VDERNAHLILASEHLESHLRDAKSEKQRLLKELAAANQRTHSVEEALLVARGEGLQVGV
jgi:hypothetical protein